MGNSVNNITSKISQSQLKQNRKIEIEVQGYSMLPYLKPGDIIYISGIKKDQLKKGMILTYESHNNTWVTHRFLRMNKDGELICKGDNVRKNDPPFNENKLIGQVTSYKRNNRIYQINTILQLIYNKILYFMKDVIPIIILIIRKVRIWNPKY